MTWARRVDWIVLGTYVLVFGTGLLFWSVVVWLILTLVWRFL